MRYQFSAPVLGKYDVAYYYCQTCGYLCADEPFWLEESYADAIAATDTGVASRNVAAASKLATLLYFLLKERGDGLYLDVAGGYGLLTRLMRDYGFNFVWTDKYCQNLMARGFEYEQEMGSCRAVTAFEILEHAEDPLTFIKQTLAFAQTDTLIFSTVLFNGNPPPPERWWYYSFETGQHISFFQERTLQTIARDLGLHLVSNGLLHMFSKRKVNELLFRACTGLAAEFVYPFTRRFLGSRSMPDHKKLVERSR